MLIKLSSNNYGRRRSLRLTAGLLFLAGVAAYGQDPNWTRPFPPFKIVGNVYWVGTYDLSTYLITTPAGDILINTGMASTVPEIKKSVEALGFKMSDIKILTATHGHVDHAAGMAELKRMTGAKLVIPERDRDLFETGGKADFVFGKREDFHFEPVKVDQVLKDGDTISLGGTVITAHHHPGHTKGATSFTFVVDGKRVVIANLPSINPGVLMTGMPGYPDIASDYAHSFADLKAIPVDIFLASHASQFGLHEKYKPGDSYDPDRFVDPAGFKKAVEELEKTYQDHVQKDNKK